MYRYYLSARDLRSSSVIPTTWVILVIKLHCAFCNDYWELIHSQSVGGAKVNRKMESLFLVASAAWKEKSRLFPNDTPPASC